MILGVDRALIYAILNAEFKQMRVLHERQLSRTLTIKAAGVSGRRTSRLRGTRIRADWALANVVAYPTKLQISRALEAIVYWELKRRGYQVRYFKHPQTDQEVDFIAYKAFDKPELAIQVAYNLDDAVTLEREIRSLINLASPEFEDTQRLVLTLGKKSTAEVKVVNLIEWLLH